MKLGSEAPIRLVSCPTGDDESSSMHVLSRHVSTSGHACVNRKHDKQCDRAQNQTAPKTHRAERARAESTEVDVTEDNC